MTSAATTGAAQGWELPEPVPVELPDRGTAWVRHHPGPDGVPTIVLLHGFAATTALNWAHVFDPPLEGFGLLAQDLRGHGRGLPGRFGLRACADDVVAVADALEVERIIVAGYSMGGAIALLAARRHPDRVDGLVLASTAAYFVASSAGAFLPPLASTVLHYVPRSLRRSAMRTFVPFASMPQRFLDEWRLHDPAGLMAAVTALRRFDATDWIHELDQPAAMVATTRDEKIPFEDQLATAVALDAEVFPLAAGHNAAIDDKARHRAAFLEACRSVAARLD